MVRFRAMTIRPFLLPLALLAAGWGSAAVVPRVLPFAAVLTLVGAYIGTRRSVNPHWRAQVRHALLAVTAFAFPLFFGGRILPWIVAAAYVGAIAAAWVPAGAGRERLAVPQALLAALGVSVAAAATQFFFPSLWRIVAASAVLCFLALLIATVPHATVGWSPSPFACAVVLGLSEGLVILHQLPAHWAANGALIAAAFALATSTTRASRVSFSAVLVSVLLIGVWTG